MSHNTFHRELNPSAQLKGTIAKWIVGNFRDPDTWNVPEALGATTATTAAITEAVNFMVTVW